MDAALNVHQWKSKLLASGIAQKRRRMVESQQTSERASEHARGRNGKSMHERNTIIIITYTRERDKVRNVNVLSDKVREMVHFDASSSPSSQTSSYA